MDQKRISDLTELAQQLQSTDYVPLLHNSVTYKYAPFNYFVKNSGSETITGVKTFNSSPIVPTATSPTEATNYGQVVKNTGDETIAGIKTFSSTPIMTIQGGSASAAKDIIQVRYDTAANWTSSNPILHLGEKGLETDTGKEKTGDGVTAWNSITKYTIPIRQGTYTPTIVNDLNITSVTARVARYTQTGNRVLVRGSVLINVTTSDVLSSFYLSTPIATAFSNFVHASGSAHTETRGGMSIYANSSGSSVMFRGSGIAAGNQELTYMFEYDIV